MLLLDVTPLSLGIEVAEASRQNHPSQFDDPGSATQYYTTDRWPNERCHPCGAGRARTGADCGRWHALI